MSFLVWWNPLTWLDDVHDSLLGSIIGALRTLFYFLSEHLYSLIIYLYNLFDALCHGRILNNDILEILSNRIGLVLGIVMLFYVVSSFIRYLVNPDQLTDSSKGAVGLIKKVMVVIVLLGISTFVFDLLYTVQRTIVDENIISKLVLPFPPNSASKDKYGEVIAAELFTYFYHVDNQFYKDNKLIDSDDGSIYLCEQYLWLLKDRIYQLNDFALGYSCLNNSAIPEEITDGNGNVVETVEKSETYIMKLDWIFLIGVGLVIVYILISYCISVGVRMIQLAVLEIMAPAAIVSYLSPKQDNMFSKWTKIYISTYIDVFLRIAIINFIIFLVITILDTSGSWEFWNTVNSTDPFLQKILGAVMIVALLIFGKKAPDLIKELVPAGASKLGGFGGNSRVAGIMSGMFGGAIAQSFGALANEKKFSDKAIGFLTGGIGGALRGGASGFKDNKGLVSGAKAGFGSGAKASRFIAQRVASGGNRFVLPGNQLRVDSLDREKSRLESQNNLAKSISGNVSAIKERALSQINAGKYVSDNVSLRNSYQQSIDSLKEQASHLNVSDFSSYAMANVNRDDYGTEDEYLNALYDTQVQAYNDAQLRISQDISHYQDLFNEAEKDAIRDFVREKSDDGVVHQNTQEIIASIANDTSGAHLSSNDVDNWDGLDNLDITAKNLVSDNTVLLSQNAKKGDKSRTNSKYSGRKS